jgi:hypothetical protein
VADEVERGSSIMVGNNPLTAENYGEAP